MAIVGCCDGLTRGPSERRTSVELHSRDWRRQENFTLLVFSGFIRVQWKILNPAIRSHLVWILSSSCISDAPRLRLVNSFYSCGSWTVLNGSSFRVVSRSLRIASLARCCLFGKLAGAVNSRDVWQDRFVWPGQPLWSVRIMRRSRKIHTSIV